MKLLPPILQSLFDAIDSEEPATLQQLEKIKSLIKAIPKFAEIRQQEIATYKQLQLDNPDITIELPLKISIDMLDERGSNLLHWAAYHGQSEIVHELLVEGKANPDIPNHHGNTPLLLAAVKNDQVTIHELLAGKANPDIQNNEGNTILIVSASKGFREIVHELIVEAKANPNIQNYGDNTALHWATIENQQEIIQELIVAKANPDLQNKSGNTPLHWAAVKGHRDIARMLIVMAKANLEIPNLNGDTALDEAIKNENLTTVSLLLSYGALVRNIGSLFDFLNRCDQRNPHVLISLTCLCNHLDTLDPANYTKVDLALFKKINDYRGKLKQLTEIYQQNAIQPLKEATNEKIPPELLSHIAAFDTPLHKARGVRFFKSADIDALLPQPKRSCSVM